MHTFGPRIREPIPAELLADMKTCLKACHSDENAGVPIGARDMAFSVLSYFSNECANEDELDLGRSWQSGQEWAEVRCTNPVRNLRYRNDRINNRSTT